MNNFFSLILTRWDCIPGHAPSAKLDARCRAPTSLLKARTEVDSHNEPPNVHIERSRPDILKIDNL